MLIVYAYKNCDSCRRALKFLREHGVDFVEIPIRETPPTATELWAMLRAERGELRRLFNTSGTDYKALRLKESLPTMTADAALALLAGNGNLVKRPFVIGDGIHLVGFDPDAWSKIF